MSVYVQLGAHGCGGITYPLAVTSWATVVGATVVAVDPQPAADKMNVTANINPKIFVIFIKHSPYELVI